MLRNLGHSASRHIVNDAARLLERWEFQASSDGMLRIRPRGPALEHDELIDLIRSLAASGACGRLRRIVFDLTRIERIGPQWTLALASQIHLARRVDTRCVALREQPRRLMQLYGADPRVAALVTGGDH